MKNLILKLKIRMYLFHSKRLQELGRQIANSSTISLVPGSEENSVQICTGYYDFFTLTKPVHGNFESFAHGGHRYKHTFKYKGVSMFYLSPDNDGV